MNLDKDENEEGDNDGVKVKKKIPRTQADTQKGVFESDKTMGRKQRGGREEEEERIQRNRGRNTVLFPSNNPNMSHHEWAARLASTKIHHIQKSHCTKAHTHFRKSSMLNTLLSTPTTWPTHWAEPQGSCVVCYMRVCVPGVRAVYIVVCLLQGPVSSLWNRWTRWWGSYQTDGKTSCSPHHCGL